jgi:D-alanine--(R)-lactate ligase
MTKLKMAILFGGRSEEHPISVKSAREVDRQIDLDRYEPYWIGITTTGAWRLCDGPSPDFDRDDLPSVMLAPDPELGGLLVVRDEPEIIPLDLIFPVLHGRGGEDGSIQGLVAASGIPAIGCDTASSVLAFDKSLTYLVAHAAGVRTPAFRVIETGDDVDADSIDYPVFVKPARSGSSFGVSRVRHPDELLAAIETARAFDSKVLIETAVIGSEIGCAILGNGSELTLGELDRVAMTHGFFRIHQETNPEAGSENAEFIVPADISPENADAVRAAARTVYRALGCRGLARVDLFLQADGSVVLNEVNTMPGLTSYSRYPRMMAAAGLPLTDVIDRLADLALAPVA